MSWFGPRYDDNRLVEIVRHAIDADPLISSPGSLTVTAKKGVITLDGVVQRESEKDRIEGVARNALRTIGIKYERIVNALTVTELVQPS